MVVLGVVAAAVAGVAALFVVAGGDDVVPFADDIGSPDMHTQEALDDLVADLREEHGTSEVFDATFYPDRAYVDLHVPGGNGERYDSYTWDGGLDEWGSSGTDDGATFELADLDASLFDGFCAIAKKQIEEAGDCYIIVDPEDAAGNGGLYSAYASNEYSEGGYVMFDSKGDEVWRTEW